MPGRILVILCCLLVGGGLYGCGGDSGDSADEQRLRQEEIERAERKGRLEERQRQETRELKREVDRLKRANRRKRSTSSAPASSAPTTSVTPSGTRPCGGDVFVGANTSCPFAQNVRDAYSRTGGGYVTVTAYSPATGRSIDMYCSGGTPHVCSGGNNASVYFP